MDYLLGRSEMFASKKNVYSGVQIQGLSTDQMTSLEQLSRLPAFSEVITKIQATKDFSAWVALDNPELSVPVIWGNDKELSKLRHRIFVNNYRVAMSNLCHQKYGKNEPTTLFSCSVSSIRWDGYGRRLRHPTFKMSEYSDYSQHVIM